MLELRLAHPLNTTVQRMYESMLANKNRVNIVQSYSRKQVPQGMLTQRCFTALIITMAAAIPALPAANLGASTHWAAVYQRTMLGGVWMDGHIKIAVVQPGLMRGQWRAHSMHWPLPSKESHICVCM